MIRRPGIIRPKPVKPVKRGKIFVEDMPDSSLPPLEPEEPIGEEEEVEGEGAIQRIRRMRVLRRQNRLNMQRRPRRRVEWRMR